MTNLKKEKEELNKELLSVNAEKVQLHSTTEKLQAKIEHLIATHDQQKQQVALSYWLCNAPAATYGREVVSPIK